MLISYILQTRVTRFFWCTDLSLYSVYVSDIIQNVDKSYRDWKYFKRENFILDFLAIDWTYELSLEKKDPDYSFSKFYDILTSLIEQNVPTREMTKRQIKTNLKPWITRGIKASIH